MLIHIEVIQEMKWINSYCSTMSFFIRNEIELFSCYFFTRLVFSEFFSSSSNHRRRLCIQKTLFPYYYCAQKNILESTLFLRVRVENVREFFSREFITDSNRVRRLFNHFSTHTRIYLHSRSSNIYENRFSPNNCGLTKKKSIKFLYSSKCFKFFWTCVHCWDFTRACVRCNWSHSSGLCIIERKKFLIRLWDN